MKHSVISPDPSEFDSGADFARHLRILELGVFLSMNTRKNVLSLARDLDRILHDQHIAQARFAMRGSSITGRAFEPSARTYTGAEFRPESDYDLAIVSHKLFERAASPARISAPTQD